MELAWLQLAAELPFFVAGNVPARARVSREIRARDFFVPADLSRILQRKQSERIHRETLVRRRLRPGAGKDVARSALRDPLHLPGRRMTASASGVAVEMRGLARRFGPQWVLRGLTLAVERGESVGVLGANGSGKSTLLRILGTLLRPNSGSALIYGRDVVREAEDVRRMIGCLSHLPGLYDDLTASENMRFSAAMLGVAPARIPEVLERVGLSDFNSERVRGFSAGMQRRLAVARLLLTSPVLLLLDEPYSNLDAGGVELINATIDEVVRKGGAAIVVLHEVAPAIGVLDRCIRLVDGRGVEEELPEDRRSRESQPALPFTEVG
jgi:heme exporter protein A